MNKKILAIVTARGGSKGIPGKNIKLLAGKPLIAYSIEAAKKAGVFDRIIMDTDDLKIAEVAKEYGCEVPFMRPKELAEDSTQHRPVLRHAIEWLKEHEGYEPEYTMCLFPTTPFRQPEHIKEAVDIILKTGADSVFGVSKVPGHFTPYRSMNMGADGKLALINGQPVRKRIMRRQDLPDSYASNGMMYLFKTENLFKYDEDAGMLGDDVRALVVDPKYNVDIDTPEDWELAERTCVKLKING